MAERMARLEKDCCVRGYHVYQTVWRAAIGESLDCVREHTNARDRYAVAVTRGLKKLEKATEITHLSSVLSHHVYKCYSSFSNYSHRNFFINIIFRIFNFRKKSLIRK